MILHSYKKLGPKYPKKGRGRIGYLIRDFRVMSLYISIHFTRQACKTSQKNYAMFSDIPIKVTERYFFIDRFAFPKSRLSTFAISELFRPLITCSTGFLRLAICIYLSFFLYSIRWSWKKMYFNLGSHNSTTMNKAL